MKISIIYEKNYEQDKHLIASIVKQCIYVHKDVAKRKAVRFTN